MNFFIEARVFFIFVLKNGAGKTSTFKIMVGEMEANRGDVLINGCSINFSKHEARQGLGYCPQFDRLPEYLTVSETLCLFAKLKGVECKEIKAVCDRMLDLFQLNEFENILVQNLSGGYIKIEI